MIFFLTGFATLVFNYKGMLSMAKSEVFAKAIQNSGNFVNQRIGNSVFINIVFAIIIIVFVYYISKKIK